MADLGEHDLALAGCQENVPHMRFMDSDLTRLAGMAAAMGDADAMLRAMGRGGGSFALMKYLPAMLLSAASPAASHQRYAANRFSFAEYGALTSIEAMHVLDLRRLQRRDASSYLLQAGRRAYLMHT